MNVNNTILKSINIPTGPKVISMILIGMVLIIIALLVFNYYSKLKKGNPLSSSANKDGSSNSSNSNSGSNSAELLFFYTDWCPHCTTAKP